MQQSVGWRTWVGKVVAGGLGEEAAGRVGSPTFDENLGGTTGE